MATFHFLGAAQSVTGSKFLVETKKSQVLFECGMFQGLKELRLRNWAKFPMPPKDVDAVVLTHAHVDHSGYLPRLAKMGFRGPVYATPATGELLKLLLPDAGHLQEEEARYANKKGYSKHSPALPLYTKEEAVASLRLVRTLDYGVAKEVAPGVVVKFHPSGHILGAGFVEVLIEGKRIVISGDIGGYDDAVMRPPVDLVSGADAVLVESTYGGRRQEEVSVPDELERLIGPVLKKRGVVVIPAFAVGRTTLVLYHLRKLQEAGRLPDVPVFVDSPMATDAVKLYCRYGNEHNLKVSLLENSKDCLIQARTTRLVKSLEDSKRLNLREGPMIIISASGMATAGRVLHHLKHRLPNRLNMVLLVGYQAIGTRGRALQDGAKKVKLLGEIVEVRAKVASIRGLSAHGDCDEVLRWLKSAKVRPKKIILVHGEGDGLKAMAETVRNEFNLKAIIPSYLQKIEL